LEVALKLAVGLPSRARHTIQQAVVEISKT